MQISTAIAQLNKEQEFMGIGLLEVLQDIQKHGKMLYCEKTMEAYSVFMAEGARMFAPVDQ
jgi:hypothetical protein